VPSLLFSSTDSCTAIAFGTLITLVDVVLTSDNVLAICTDRRSRRLCGHPVTRLPPQYILLGAKLRNLTLFRRYHSPRLDPGYNSIFGVISNIRIPNLSSPRSPQPASINRLSRYNRTSPTLKRTSVEGSWKACTSQGNSQPVLISLQFLAHLLGHA
jgi:hypothetical protein